ncbi:MAG: RNA-guided endonuclease TnpB family protein [Blautia massiliensis (ex Durand et al. 2017)]
MNRAVKIRIYPNKEQRVQIEQTIGCSRFIYNQMLADKISYYQKEKKMLRNTPAGYKKEYPWLKEVDSLALANAQLHLESAFRKFFREPACGFPRYKSKKHARNSYTTNALNGNILLQDTYLKLPKMSVIRIKLHRQIPSDWKLKSVTVSREPSGKYLASLLFCCENQTVEKKTGREISWDRFCHAGNSVYFLQEKEPGTLCFTEKQRKNLQENRESSPTVKKEAGTIRNRKKG